MTTIAFAFGFLGGLTILLGLTWHFITRPVDRYLREWYRPDYDEWSKEMYE